MCVLLFYFSDDLKVKMSQSNLKEHLIKVLHAHSGQNEDEDKLMEKLSSDLIVLLLTGGKGVLFVNPYISFQNVSPGVKDEANLKKKIVHRPDLIVSSSQRSGLH